MILKKSKLMNNAIFIKTCKCLKKDIKLSSLQEGWIKKQLFVVRTKLIQRKMFYIIY